jgi:hypothetical protein
MKMRQRRKSLGGSLSGSVKGRRVGQNGEFIRTDEAEVCSAIIGDGIQAQ